MEVQWPQYNNIIVSWSRSFVGCHASSLLFYMVEQEMCNVAVDYKGEMSWLHHAQFNTVWENKTVTQVISAPADGISPKLTLNHG